MKKMRRDFSDRIADNGNCQCTVIFSDVFNAPELRELIEPGSKLNFYPETISIEDEIAFISVSGESGQKLTVPIAKLEFQTEQFVKMVRSNHDLYRHCLGLLRKIDPSLKPVSHEKMHGLLKSGFSSNNVLIEDDIIKPWDEDSFLDIGPEDYLPLADPKKLVLAV